MKKYIIGITIISTMALVTSWSINKGQNSSLEDLALNNIEALAGGEGGFEPGNYYITDVTATSHRCHTGGPFSCNID